MNSKEDELPNDTTNNNTDDSVAFNKKRGRRVSFAAEITSVHVFDRDDDAELETPPAAEDKADDVDVPEFFKDLDDESFDGGGGGSSSSPGPPFLQPFESPGSNSAFGSATSNDDEDNYFGPVASEFIRPGRLSDSVASDDNPEMTLDSTAFSMHFQSLAKSESGCMKTPTGGSLVFEEKTPTQSGTMVTQGSSMELTWYDKAVPHVPMPVDNFPSGKDSNEMSLVEDNPRKYDYAAISPRLDELMSDGNKFPGNSTFDGINGTNYIGKNSSSNWIPNASNSSKQVQAADMGSPRVDASANASVGVRQQLLTSPHSLIIPSENRNQSSRKHNTATEITGDLASHHEEAHIPVITSGRLPQLSSPAPSFGQSIQREHSHSQGDLLKQSETTPKSDSSDQKCHPQSPVIPYISTSVDLSKGSPREGKGRLESNTTESVAIPNQSPSVATTSFVYNLKEQLAMGVSNTTGLPILIPSVKSDLFLSNNSGTNSDLRYSSEKKELLGLKLNGVASVSCTPVAEDSSIRSKLSSCIVKTSRRDVPVSRLEYQFMGIEDVFENLGRSLLNQAGIERDVTYSSKRKNISRLKSDGLSFINVTPLAEASSIRSKLSSCIVKTPQQGRLVSRLEEQFISIEQELSVQKKTADMNENEFMTTGDNKDLPINVLIKSNGTLGISSQLTTPAEKERQRPSTLEQISRGTKTMSENEFSSPSITRDFHSDKNISGAPVGMVFSQNQNLVSGLSPHHNRSVPHEIHGSPCILNDDVVQSYHTDADSSSVKILYDNTNNKSGNNIKKSLPSQNNSIIKSPTRYEDILHLELNQQNQTDKAIQISPEGDGDLMEITSSRNHSNVVARKLDNMFIKQNQYSRSPLILIDHVRSPLLAHSMVSGDSNNLLRSTGLLQTPLKTEAFISSDANLDSSGVSFAPHTHASADKSLITVQTATKESSPSAIGKYVSRIKAPKSSVHKRGHDQLDTGNEHSTPNVDKPRRPKILRKEESVNLNNYYDNDQSRHGSMVTLKHWSSIFSKALADSELSCSTTFDRLDLQKIDLLEDVLLRLQKVHTITGICGSIQTQMVGDHYKAERSRRISETNELLQKLIYEQTKLKLMRAKREKLLQRVEVVRSGIQRCHALKLNCSQLPACIKCNSNSRHWDTQPLTDWQEDQQNIQVPSQEILELRQKVGTAQREIDSLLYSFHTCFKMKEKSSNVDTIAVVNDCLKRRALFKSLRGDVQLWEIDDMMYKKGQNKISLNYHGYLIQRFTLVAPISTVTISCVLNYSNIEKKYPHMDAHVAFSYAFKVDAEQKYVGIRSLAQNTQVTSSVLSSLLDVVEEVKLARLEIKCLKDARFLSPSAGKLDLCLHFVDFKTGMKVNTILDISCLCCGVYPSDVIPSQLHSYPPVTTDSFAAGLQAATENLKLGFSRIIRICSCISQELSGPS